MTTLENQSNSYIQDGQPLVYTLASRIHRNLPVRVDLDDLIGYGELGLAEAAREFDPARGVQFTTFAYYRIRGAIYDGVSKMSWTSRARLNRLRYLQRANEALQEHHNPGQQATMDDDAAWFSGAVEKLAIVYLASQTSGDADGENRILDAAVEPEENAVEVREISERLHKLIDNLAPGAHRMIRAIYFEGLTLTEAAEQQGISKSWASRLHARTLEELATSLRRIGAD